MRAEFYGWRARLKNCVVVCRRSSHNQRGAEQQKRRRDRIAASRRGVERVGLHFAHLLLLHRLRRRRRRPQAVEWTIAELVGVQTAKHADETFAHNLRRLCLTQIGAESGRRVLRGVWRRQLTARAYNRLVACSPRSKLDRLDAENKPSVICRLEKLGYTQKAAWSYLEEFFREIRAGRECHLADALARETSAMLL